MRQPTTRAFNWPEVRSGLISISFIWVVNRPDVTLGHIWPMDFDRRKQADSHNRLEVSQIYSGSLTGRMSQQAESGPNLQWASNRLMSDMAEYDPNP